MEEAEVAEEVDATVTAEAPEAEPPEELNEAVTVLNQIRSQVNQLDVRTLESEDLDSLLVELAKLRKLSEILAFRRSAAVLLTRFNEISATYVKTIALVGIEPAIETRRARLSQPGDVLGDVEVWLEGMAERLQTIAAHDEEIQGLMRRISAAAADNDLATIEQHTAAAHERKAVREDAIGALQRHLG